MSGRRSFLALSRQQVEPGGSPCGRGLFLDGGPHDAAHATSLRSFDLVTVPAAHVETQTVEILVNRLDLTLNDNQQASEYFTGRCDLCGVPGWSVQTANGL